MPLMAAGASPPRRHSSTLRERHFMARSTLRRSASKRVAVLLLAAASCLAVAQDYPAKAVRIIVPAQPGGGLDLVGRTVGDLLSRALKQSFVIENISGGGGLIATQTTQRAAHDGYTLMVGY